MKKVSVCLCGRATGGLVGPPPENNPPRFLGARRTPGGGAQPSRGPLEREKKKATPPPRAFAGRPSGGTCITLSQYCLYASNGVTVPIHPTSYIQCFCLWTYLYLRVLQGGGEMSSYRSLSK